MELGRKETNTNERIKMFAKCRIHDDCSLCLSSMKNKLVVVLPCGHTFHNKCHSKLRDAAAAYRYRCPVCRHNCKSQIQRLKMLDIFGEEYWNQYYNYVRSLSGGTPPWLRESQKRNIEEFEDWILNGLSEEELEEMNNALMRQSLENNLNLESRERSPSPSPQPSPSLSPSYESVSTTASPSGELTPPTPVTHPDPPDTASPSGELTPPTPVTHPDPPDTALPSHGESWRGYTHDGMLNAVNEIVNYFDNVLNYDSESDRFGDSQPDSP